MMPNLVRPDGRRYLSCIIFANVYLSNIYNKPTVRGLLVDRNPTKIMASRWQLTLQLPGTAIYEDQSDSTYIYTYQSLDQGWDNSVLS